MEAQSMFLTLLQWLASATGVEAKSGGLPILDFAMPEVAQKIDRRTETHPYSRNCCILGVQENLEYSTLWKQPHQFRPKNNPLSLIAPGGGATGFVYTKHGGFIDLGHARDLIDYTRYFAGMYASSARRGGEKKLFESESGKVAKKITAHVYLAAQSASPPPDSAMCALIGAKLAFEYSVWHEIESYFTDEKLSSFSPEDLFSNAVGALAGFKALLDPTIDPGSTSFDLAFDFVADRALKEILESLVPYGMEITDKATEYVKGRWFPALLNGKRRRSFLQSGPITPWLVTDLAIPGRDPMAAELAQVVGKPQATGVLIPTHYNGIFLEERAHLVFKNLLQEIGDLVPTMSEIRSIDLLTVSTRVRDLARAQEEATIDQP